MYASLGLNELTRQLESLRSDNNPAVHDYPFYRFVWKPWLKKRHRECDNGPTHWLGHYVHTIWGTVINVIRHKPSLYGLFLYHEWNDCGQYYRMDVIERTRICQHTGGQKDRRPERQGEINIRHPPSNYVVRVYNYIWSICYVDEICLQTPIHHDRNCVIGHLSNYLGVGNINNRMNRVFDNLAIQADDRLVRRSTRDGIGISFQFYVWMKSGFFATAWMLCLTDIFSDFLDICWRNCPVLCAFSPIEKCMPINIWRHQWIHHAQIANDNVQSMSYIL